MNINQIELGNQFIPLQDSLKQPTSKNSESFSDTLKEFVSDVNSLQKDSTNMNERLIKGEPVDIHEVMISAEKAKTSFQLLLELRGKAIDLYSEVNKIQV